MSELMLYILKVSLGLGVVVIPYMIFFRNDSNLVLKRFYLLTGIISAWLFPLLTISKPDFLHLFSNAPVTQPFPVTVAPTVVTVSEPLPSPGTDWFMVIPVLYFAGMILLFFRNLFFFISVEKVWKKSGNPQDRIVYTDSNKAFTFLNRIFIPKIFKDDRQSGTILIHERAHIRQYHYIDLILSEWSLLLTWFNPFSWLISRMIKENHEHLADREVLSRGINPAHYRAQLLDESLGVSLFRLGHQFNHSLTKKRFKMMKKTCSSRIEIWKYFLLVPAILMMLGLFSGTRAQEPVSIVKGKVIFAKTGEAAAGTSVVIKGTTTGTVADRNGEFALEVEGDPEIVFSFVGFETSVLKASEIKNKPIALEVKTYQINLDTEREELEHNNAKSITIRQKDTHDGPPVFVVDGKVVKDISGIDPEDIERIEVIKDTGSEQVKKYNAEHGLILIFLKKEEEIIKPSVEAPEEVFIIVEEMPSFPGGETALKHYVYSNLEYPEDAYKKGISGEVKIQFTVTASGLLDDIKVLRSTYAGFDEPALKVFRNMPRWNPGMQRGKPVNVQLFVPVKFSLPSE